MREWTWGSHCQCVELKSPDDQNTFRKDLKTCIVLCSNNMDKPPTRNCTRLDTHHGIKLPGQPKSSPMSTCPTIVYLH